MRRWGVFTVGDGGRATYKITKPQIADYGDYELPNGNLTLMQRMGKSKKPKKRRGMDGTLR